MFPVWIKRYDPQARCVAGNSASLVTGFCTCPWVRFFHPHQKHMKDTYSTGEIERRERLRVISCICIWQYLHCPSILHSEKIMFILHELYSIMTSRYDVIVIPLLYSDWTSTTSLTNRNDILNIRHSFSHTWIADNRFLNLIVPEINLFLIKQRKM